MMDVMTDLFLNGMGKSSLSFEECINKALSDNKTITRLPSYVIQRLAVYKMYIMIEEEGNKLTQSVLVTILMNYLILYKGKFNEVPLPKLIHSFYKYRLCTYLEKNDKICLRRNSSSVISKVADKKFDVSDLTDDDLAPLKEMAKEACMYRCNLLLSDKTIKDEEDLFVRAYIALKNYVQAIDYPFYNIALNDLLSQIFSKVELNRKKKLRTIVGKLSSKSTNDENVGCYTSSSIILRLIQGQKVVGSECILEEQFSLFEFAAYLYYELLVERILETIE
jgi:hypothetical protein